MTRSSEVERKLADFAVWFVWLGTFIAAAVLYGSISCIPFTLFFFLVFSLFFGPGDR